MAKQKLKRFAEFSSFTHTFDFPYELRGKWKQDVFRNDHPLVLELGCGKGEYTVALAREYPDKNFTGIDIKSNRMWKGAGVALEDGLKNATFMRALMHRITELYAPGEVDEIWITFPDPFPRARSAKHRLTHTRYLRFYKEILKPGGLINFKTDSDELFTFTMDMLERLGITPLNTFWNVHQDADAPGYLKNIRTYYENLFMKKGKAIKYVQFSLDDFTEEKAVAFEEWMEVERQKEIASREDA